jgi:hypothetical protein
VTSIPLALACLISASVLSFAQQPAEFRVPAPELRGIEKWINSKPLSLKQLRGKVVILHFWTFG